MLECGAGGQNVLYRDLELESGISRLKYSFALYGIGTIVFFVPLVGEVGSILLFVAFILLIMGWRALGRSSLSASETYHITSNIIIITAVIAFLVAFLGIIASFSSFFSSVSSSPPPSNPADVTALPGFSQLIYDFAIVFSIGILIAFLGQIKSALSFRRLATDLTQSKLKSSGNLLILSLCLSFAALIVIFAELPSLISVIGAGASGTSQLSSLYVFFGGGFVLAGILAIAQSALVLIACYLGYSSLNNAGMNFPPKYAPSFGYPPYPSPPPTRSRICATCGSRTNSSSDNFCTSCGAKLSAG